MSNAVHLIALSLFAALLLAAAWRDFTAFTISNRLTSAMVLLYPAWAMAHPAGVDVLPALAWATAVLACGFALFAAGWFGGGDVKLLTVVTLWAGPDLAPPVLLLTVMLGGALAMLYASPLHAMLPAPPQMLFREGLRPSKARSSMPYGVAIAAAGLYAVAMLAGS